MATMDLADIEKAYSRIEPHIHRTPVIVSQYMDQLSGRQLFFKAENLQKTGSFKPRGACNAVLCIKEENPGVPGVVTHSSGNHGQAVAYAAGVAGLSCKVVVPRGTSQVKVDAIRSYGAQLIFCQPTPQSRVTTCEEIALQTGFALVDSYDDLRVMSGQGTVALEFHQQVVDLDVILVSVSGGGLISGIATATRALRPNCRVYAVEPSGKGLGECLQLQRRQCPLSTGTGFLTTLADGCTTRTCGRLTFPIMCRLIEQDVFTVTDAHIVAATKLFWQRAKYVIEPSAGMVVGAAISDQMKQLPAEVRKVGVVLCGGNVDFDNIFWK